MFDWFSSKSAPDMGHSKIGLHVRPIVRALITILFGAGAGAGAGIAAYATETINYSYDARGRLVKAQRTGSVNDNVTAEYKYDKADNRTNVNVTSPNPPPP